MEIGTFAGLSLTVGGLVAGITQIIKVTETIPYLNKIPFVQRLLDTIVSGSNVREKRIFVAILCYLISVLLLRFNTGDWPVFDFDSSIVAFTAFFNATAGHALFLKKKVATINPAL